MNFRIATDSDVPALADLCKQFHEESRFGYIEYSAAKALKIWAGVKANPKSRAILIAVEGKDVLGFLYCTAGEYYVGVGTILTTVQAMFVRQSTRKSLLGGKATLGLITMARQWGEARQSKEMIVLTNSGIDPQRTVKGFAKMGFEAIGANFGIRVG